MSLVSLGGQATKKTGIKESKAMRVAVCKGQSHGAKLVLKCSKMLLKKSNSRLREGPIPKFNSILPKTPAASVHLKLKKPTRCFKIVTNLQRKF